VSSPREAPLPDLPAVIEDAIHRWTRRHNCNEHVCADLKDKLRAAIREALEVARMACARESHRVLGDHYDEPYSDDPAHDCSGCRHVREAEL